MNIVISIVYFININPLTTNVPHLIEISHWICRSNKSTNFYMMGNIGRKLLNPF